MNIIQKKTSCNQITIIYANTNFGYYSIHVYFYISKKPLHIWVNDVRHLIYDASYSKTKDPAPQKKNKKKTLTKLILPRLRRLSSSFSDYTPKSV